MSSLVIVWEAACRGGVLLAVLFPVIWLLTRRTPALRHVGLVAALLAVGAMPFIVPFVPQWVVPVLPVVTDLIGAAPGDAGGSLGLRTPAAGLPSAGFWLVLLSALWATGSLLLLARLGYGLVRLHQWIDAAAWAGRSVKIPGSRVRVVFSAAVDLPVAAGFVRPVVLLPAASRQWSRARRRAVLAHELAHIRRGDTWINAIVGAVVAQHWINPMVWWAARQARSAAEESADEAVVRRGAGATEYASFLVDFAHRRGRMPIQALAFGSRRSLSARIENLVRGCRPTRARERVGVATAVAAIALVLASATIGFSPEVIGRFAQRYSVSPDVAAMVLEAAQRERVDPVLAFGLVRAESDFDADRVSPTGAVGFTQILPATAQRLEPGLRADELRRPELNLRLGFRLLRGYIDLFDGDTHTALFAYHRGPAAAAAGLASTDPYPRRVMDAAAGR